MYIVHLPEKIIQSSSEANPENKRGCWLTVEKTKSVSIHLIGLAIALTKSPLLNQA